jgi:hypothetical protein
MNLISKTILHSTFYILHSTFYILIKNRPKLTCIITQSAPCTFFLHNKIGMSGCANNSIGRTFLCTNRAPGADINTYKIGTQLVTDT